MSALFWLPPQSNPFLKGKKSSVYSFLLALRKVTVIMHGFDLRATAQMGAVILNLLVFINPKFQWHVLTNSESTFLFWLCIDSLTGFFLSVMHIIIQMFPFMRESVNRFIASLIFLFRNKQGIGR